MEVGSEVVAMPYLIVPSVYCLGRWIPACARVRGRRDGAGSCVEAIGKDAGRDGAPDPATAPDPAGAVGAESPGAVEPTTSSRVAGLSAARAWGSRRAPAGACVAAAD
jgi:hypothetical protein